jgi:hypothetical protein
MHVDISPVKTVYNPNKLLVRKVNQMLNIMQD